MEKFVYQNQAVRCNITGPSECGESVFLKNLIFYNTNGYHEVYN